MHRRRVASAVVAVVALGFAVAACGSSSPSPATKSGQGYIVALGDSVPHGTNCGCTPYPQLTAGGLTTTTGQKVTAANDAVAGYTTSDVLNQLQADTAVIDRVRKADVVEIEIGANDVAYSASCGTNTNCYAPAIPAIQTNLDAIVARVHKLASTHKVLVVLLDYWSVWLGGKYAAAKGEAYVDAAANMTADVNATIKSAAARTASAYVDLRAAFKGPDYAYDETHYLSSDGDHPNAAGHQRIADTTEAAIETALHL
jgi:lysophospholipase L1-like esterase